MFAHDPYQVRVVRYRRGHIEVHRYRPDRVSRRAGHHVIFIEGCLRLSGEPADVADGAYRNSKRRGGLQERKGWPRNGDRMFVIVRRRMGRLGTGGLAQRLGFVCAKSRTLLVVVNREC